MNGRNRMDYSWAIRGPETTCFFWRRSGVPGRCIEAAVIGSFSSRRAPADCRKKIAMVVFLNGKFVTEARAVVSVNDRGFLYGDGLFETVRVFNGHPFRMAQHLE